jgi:hypothetical protein
MGGDRSLAPAGVPRSTSRDNDRVEKDAERRASHPKRYGCH